MTSEEALEKTIQWLKEKQAKGEEVSYMTVLFRHVNNIWPLK